MEKKKLGDVFTTSKSTLEVNTYNNICDLFHFHSLSYTQLAVTWPFFCSTERHETQIFWHESNQELMICGKDVRFIRNGWQLIDILMFQPKMWKCSRSDAAENSCQDRRCRSDTRLSIEFKKEKKRKEVFISLPTNFPWHCCVKMVYLHVLRGDKLVLLSLI